MKDKPFLSSQDEYLQQLLGVENVKSSIQKTKRLFICYRHKDSKESTGRLHDRLKDKFNVFRDVKHIEAGERFRELIAVELSKTNAVLVVIGPDWATIKDEMGQLRLSNAGDYVRMEIEIALKDKIPLIPVLVMGATRPNASDLPETIRSLGEIHSIEVRSDPDFEHDFAKLCRAIEKILKIPQSPTQIEEIKEILRDMEQEQRSSRERERSIYEKIDRLDRKALDRHSELITSIMTLSSRLNAINAILEMLRDQQRHLRLLDGSVGELLRHNGLIQSDM